MTHDAACPAPVSDPAAARGPGRTRTAARALAAALAATPGAAAAETPLRGVMHVWRADARTVRDMLDGRAAPDPAVLSAILARYDSDAGRIAAALTAGTVEARDLRARFTGFAADARGAMTDLTARRRLARDFGRVMADCRSCHDVYR